MTSGFPIPFGKYLLTDLIAVGGMAEIYRAKIFGVNGFEKQMVVKRILPKYAQNTSFVQMFVDEAKILVSLTHGNIVPVYELGEVGGNYYIAMEYAEGITALDLLRECYVKARSLSIPQALYIAAEVAKGLGFAHTKTDANGDPLYIVHRDLNPRNIVVSPSGEVKILDFGIARSTKKKHQTGSGVIKGTPGYMAPEQVMGMTVDQRADQYGLAIIVHELLTVRRLIPVKDVTEHRARLAGGPLPTITELRPDATPEVDAVIMRALAERPEDRFPSVLDFEDALRGLNARMGASITSRGLATTISEIKAAPAVDSPDQVATTKPLSRPQEAEAPPPPSAQPPPPPPVSGGAEPPLVQSDFQQAQRAAPAPRPLPPSLPVASMSQRPQTQVLAANQALEWSKNIGADAELLALARASGLQGPGPRRALWAGVAVVLLLVGGWAATHRDEVSLMLQRASEGRRATVGTLIVKSRPSGGVVFIDGKQAGKTNMRLDDVNLDVPHELVVRLEDGRELKRELKADDFGKERKLELMFDPAAEAAPE